jgi:hypothetical protein
MDYHHVRFFVRNIFVFVITCSVAAFSSGSIQQDLNDYFAGIDTTLSTLQRSQALRSTERRPAENLFIRELKEISHITLSGELIQKERLYPSYSRKKSGTSGNGC